MWKNVNVISLCSLKGIIRNVQASLHSLFENVIAIPLFHQNTSEDSVINILSSLIYKLSVFQAFDDNGFISFM